MINGVDLAILVVLLGLLLIGWEATGRYFTWVSWDQERRYLRKKKRHILQDELREKDYRRNIRFTSFIVQITASTSKFTEAMNNLTRQYKALTVALDKDAK